MPRRNLSDDLRRIDEERKRRALEHRVSELERLNKALHHRLDQQDDELEAVAAAAAPVSPLEIRPRDGRVSTATAFMIASDWHLGEVVDPATVNDRNEFGPEIAEARAKRFFQNGVALLNRVRGDDVDTLVLAVLGDMMTGYIHEELVEGNSMSPSEEVLFAQRLLAGGINYLLEHANVGRIIVPCCYGNHGRTTQKRRIATGARNSWEWLMYHQLAARFRKEKRVEFLIADGSHLYLDVYDYVIRFHHGDDVRYGGGVGGLSIPLAKAVKSWDTFKRADLTVIGHWHQLKDFGHSIVNGSLKGYDPFALSVKAEHEPPRQAFFIIDSRRGKTIVAPIFVE